MLKLRIDIDVVCVFYVEYIQVQQVFRSNEYIVMLGYGTYSDTGLNQEVSPGTNMGGGAGEGAFQLIEKN